MDTSQPGNFPNLAYSGAAPTATATKSGTVLQAPAQADSTAVDVAGLVIDFNAMLAKLRTAGVIAAI